MSGMWAEAAAAQLAIFAKKFDIVNTILKYHNPDVICLQEVDWKSLSQMEDYEIFTPSESNGKQDSVILLRKGLWKDVQSESLERTLVTATLRATGEKVIIASYHGEANGITTIPFRHAMRAFMVAKCPDCVLIIGSDTNAHTAPEPSSRKLSFSHLQDFAASQNWLLANTPPVVTTRSCRTLFQAQSHKGQDQDDIIYASDPKDNIMIDKASISAFSSNTNPIPNSEFPSDHAQLWAKIVFPDIRSELFHEILSALITKHAHVVFNVESTFLLTYIDNKCGIAICPGQRRL